MRRSIVTTIILLSTSEIVACSNASSPSNQSLDQAGANALSTGPINSNNGAASVANVPAGASTVGLQQTAGALAGGTAGKGTGKALGGSAAFAGTGGNGGAKTATGGRNNTGGSGATGGKQSNGGSGGTTTGNDVQPPPIVGGSNGWASRYWDCCKPACGWKDNARNTNGPMSSCDKQGQNLGTNYDARNSCEVGGTAFMCWNFAPWAVSNTLAYGFVAASAGNYSCGRCYQLQFTGSGHSGNNAGATSLNGKTMIVQVINNGGVRLDQFDLLIPGGGVGDFNGCSTQWGVSDLGARYGGFLAACNGDKGCVQQRCQSVFSNKPDLMAGCEWFLDWFNAADNPNFVFKQIACPAAIVAKSGMQG